MSELESSSTLSPPLVPPIVFGGFLISVTGAAALANCAVLAALLRCPSKKGSLSIVRNLSFADILLGATIVPELWACNSKKWVFGTTGCTLYQGTIVLVSTASLYLLTTIALHSLATINLEINVSKRRKEQNCGEEDEMKTSRHSLVTSSDSSTPPRTMSIDYYLSNSKVPVKLPIVFVWILAISLSIPEYVLASLSHQDNNTICAIDSNHRFNMHSMLVVFVLFVPFFIISSAISFIIIRLNSNKSLQVSSRNILKLCLCLLVTYATLCAPRSILSAYDTYSRYISETPESPLNNYLIMNLILGIMYLLATLVRPVLYFVFIPELRNTTTISKEIDI